MRTRRRLVQNSRSLGCRALLFRIPYETLNRTGMRTLLEPAGVVGAQALLRGEDLRGVEAWRSERTPFILRPVAVVGSSLDRLRMGEVSLGEEQLRSRVEAALAGEVWAFSSQAVRVGRPTRWHRDPASGAEWPLVHWSRSLRAPPTGADVKWVWEIARFPHAYLFVRQYARDRQSQWVRSCFDGLHSWERENPFRLGVHWASGQELAIRVLAWIVALFAFGDDPALTDDDVRAVQRLAVLHAYHIERHIGYARWSMRNNHLIGEALGLLLVGQTFPWLRRARAWAAFGRELLEGDALSQFEADGGYMQNSHTYHRLALDYLSVGLLATAAMGEPLHSTVAETVDRSMRLLQAQMNANDGRLPNFGENDGAQLLPLTGSDYTDFRPSLVLAHHALGGFLEAEAGAWLEMRAWLGARVPSEVKPCSTPTSFVRTGLHVLREGPGDFAVLRTGPWSRTTGHADLNHLDLWCGGRNVAIDTGSYLYNAETHVHEVLMGTSLHNTVSFDGATQRPRLRRWAWGGRVDAWGQGGEELIGECRAFGHVPGGPVLHRRRVRRRGDRWEIDDEVEACAVGEFQLQWLLSGVGWRVVHSEDDTTWMLVEEAADDPVRVALSVAAEPAATAAMELVCGRQRPPRGWHSRYYGQLEPAWSLTLSVLAMRVEFSTVFTHAGTAS